MITHADVHHAPEPSLWLHDLRANAQLVVDAIDEATGKRFQRRAQGFVGDVGRFRPEIRL